MASNSWFEKMKERWGITSNFSIIIIFIVFSVTGSSAIYVAKLINPLLDILDLSTFSRWVIRIITVFIAYQILLLIFGFIFGQFKFFWIWEKKILLLCKKLFTFKR